MENIKDDRGYNQVWADSESTRIRAERRCDYMISQMDTNQSKSIMEIGCGTGKNSFMLAQKTGMKVFGADLCATFIEEAQKNYASENLRFSVMNFNNPESLKGQKFDYIIGNGILHHLYHNLDEAFKNILFLLKDNGKIIFMEPNLENPYCYLIFSFPYFRKLAKLEPDEMAFSRTFIREKIQQAGFSSSNIMYKDFLLPGIPDILIKPSIVVGDIAEKIPVINKLAQSLFIIASK